MSDGNGKDRGPSQAPPRRAVDGPAGRFHKPQRFSAKLKSRIVLRFLRGDDLELLSREYGATAAQISQWRDDFIAAGEIALKKREVAESDEIKRLREKLGEVTMDSELLREKIIRLEQNRPLPRRRSRK
jgi:transposase-like protein